MQIKAVLFDLDGTLFDTSRDIIDSVNIVLERYKLDRVIFEKVKPYVSYGTLYFIEKHFNLRQSDPEHMVVRNTILQEYAKRIYNHTRLYPGINELLSYLECNNIRWGIVTNKPESLTTQLLKHAKLFSSPEVVIGADTLLEKKPHPLPLLHACEALGASPTEALFIGDSEVDAKTGKNAGVRTVIVNYGFSNSQDERNSWSADHYVDVVPELITLVQEKING